ncbi:MAG: creatininase family protein [Phycisphaeraceae bacterium]|nr:creatininase family protein [Phycisphaeraceae bacterium]
MVPDVHAATFEEPGSHADEMETSLMLYMRPDLVAMEHAGKGEKRPFELTSIQKPGMWTPRPWSKIHPDTGDGDPSKSTAEKGKRYFDAITETLADAIVELSFATKGQLPYV